MVAFVVPAGITAARVAAPYVASLVRQYGPKVLGALTGASVGDKFIDIGQLEKDKDIGKLPPSVKTETEEDFKIPPFMGVIPSVVDLIEGFSQADSKPKEKGFVQEDLPDMSKLASNVIEKNMKKKGTLAEIIKDPTSKVNKVLLEIGDEKISSMTNKELTDYIRKNYPDLKITDKTIPDKKLPTIPEKIYRDFGEGRKKLTEVLSGVKNPEQYTAKELMNLPEVKKVMDDFGMDSKYFTKIKSTLKIKSKKTDTQAKTRLDMSNFGVDEKDVIKFLKENPSTTSKEIQTQFPKLEKISTSTLQKWRKRNNVSYVPKKKQYFQDSPLIATSEELQKQLDFIPEGSKIPIKHKDAFSEIVTINRDGKPFDVTRTKIIQAHGIGGGGISDTSQQIIKSKVAMIPDKFLEDEKLPKFFLTRAGNLKHRDIENNLILALVNKYDKLGYNFVDGAWKQTKKVNPKSVSKELKDLETEIAGYQNELKDLDAYTLFYNPVKDKMVTYGKPLSEIPGLSNLLNKVLKGEKKLRKGGIVSMEEMIQPISLKYTS